MVRIVRCDENRAATNRQLRQPRLGEWVENRCNIARWSGLGGVEKSAPGNYELTSQCLSVTSSPRRFRLLLLVPALILTAVYAAVKLASGPYFLSANFDRTMSIYLTR